MQALFEYDWSVAKSSHELAWHIVKSDKAPSTWRALDKDGDHEEVEQV